MRVDGRDELEARVDELLHDERIVSLSLRMSARVPISADVFADSRLAAVAAIVRLTHEPELLFIKRAELARDPWSGHIAFPGGRAEAGDVSLQATAIRETCEELALNLNEGRILGRLDDLAPRTPSLPPIIVRPFVAVVAGNPTLSLSGEVASAFWVPISMLRSQSASAEHTITANGATMRFPAFRVQEHLVWGLTERIVRQLLPLFDL